MTPGNELDIVSIQPYPDVDSVRFRRYRLRYHIGLFTYVGRKRFLCLPKIGFSAGKTFLRVRVLLQLFLKIGDRGTNHNVSGQLSFPTQRQNAAAEIVIDSVAMPCEFSTVGRPCQAKLCFLAVGKLGYQTL